MIRWINSLFSFLVFALVAIGVQASDVVQPAATTYELSLYLIDTGDPVMVSPAPNFESTVTILTTETETLLPDKTPALAGGPMLIATIARPSNDGLTVDHMLPISNGWLFGSVPNTARMTYEVGWRS